MVQRTFTETYDYLRRIAPEFTARIAQAAAQVHNETEVERELNNAIAAIADELDIGLPLRQQFYPPMPDKLLQQVHELAPAAYGGDEAAQTELRRVEDEIDRAAPALWGLSEEELAEIRRSLEELRK